MLLTCMCRAGVVHLSQCKGKETLFKQVLADRDLDGLKADAAANGGAVTVEVCGVTVALRLNTHFFFSHAAQFAGDADARAAWAAAGVEGLGLALVDAGNTGNQA